MNIIDGWIDTALEIDYDNKSMSRQGQKVTHICLHGTAGGTSAEGIAHYFHDSPVQASAHIIIGTDGHVVQGMSLDDAAWSNGIILHPRIPWDASINPNLYTASIEHVKASTDNSDELTPAQKLASFQVIAAICDYYGIAKRRGDVHGGIISHADLDSVNRARCPGPYPWDELMAFLTGSPVTIGEDTTMLQITDPFAATYFVDKGGGRWHCTKTQVDIIGGILAFYRAINGAVRLPLTGEQYTIPGVVWQVFESAILVYDPQKKLDNPTGSGPCYLAKLDSPLAKSILATSTLDLAAITNHVQAIMTLLGGKP
jgi:hypothetical protein